MSIYAQITNRCNMTCAHCCFSCGLEGDDMTEETFKKCVDLAAKNEVAIGIGGGEPTMHPLFMDFLLYAIAMKKAGEPKGEGRPHVSLTTNGTDTKVTLALAKLAKNGFVQARLSKDKYHDNVAPEVYQAFEGASHWGWWSGVDMRMISGPPNKEDQILVIPKGRAADLSPEVWGHRKNDCVCSTLFVNPLGEVWPCGCKKTHLGNINQMNSIDRRYLGEQCERYL